MSPGLLGEDLTDILFGVEIDAPVRLGREALLTIQDHFDEATSNKSFGPPSNLDSHQITLTVRTG